MLLTGGAGFIGQHVLRELLARGHEVRVLNSLRADVHGEAPWTPPANIEFGAPTSATMRALDRALAGIEAVVHLAAKVELGVDIGTCRTMPPRTMPVPRELLAAMARAGVKRLTLASSMVVYGEGVGHCPGMARSRPGRATKPRSPPGNSSHPARTAARRSHRRW